MGWKLKKWKLNFRGSKDQWLVILAMGLILLILAFPTGGRSKGISIGKGSREAESIGEINGGSYGGAEAGYEAAGMETEKSSGRGVAATWQESGGDAAEEAASQTASQTTSKSVRTYEQQLEDRLKELLGHVDGVGEVEVMIVLKSSEERVWRTDRNTSYSMTQETDSNGGTRDIKSQEMSESTILSGQSGAQEPLLEKELKPEISGVVVSATGGGSPSVQAEISAAVEALFGVPSHKIKVLKRVE